MTGWSGLTRRAALALMALLASGATSPALPLDRRRHLRDVVRWAIQYQAIDIGAVSASELDLIVVDPSLDDAAGHFIAPEDLDRLKRKPDGRRRLVLAYLPVGEADTKRWYWPENWRRTPPDWGGPENPAWPGARHVRFWHPAWREMLFEGNGSLLDHILDAGYDGAFLDRVDAYFDWRDERATAQDDMIDLIAALRQRLDAVRPDFILLSQNAEHLMVHRRYLDLIDGVNKESLLSGLAGENRRNSDGDVAWSLHHLRLAQEAGVVIFATEYATDPRLRTRLRAEIAGLGFKPFMGGRALDRLPTDP